MIAVNLAENVLVEHRWVNIFYSSRAERILAGTSLNGTRNSGKIHLIFFHDFAIYFLLYNCKDNKPP